MAITFTTGNPAENAPVNPTQKKKPNPQEQAKERERKRLQDKQKQIQKKLDTLKTSIDEPIRKLAKLLMAADPNDNPQELFKQIAPLIEKLHFTSKVDASKTELTDQTRGKERLYKVVLRRGTQIAKDELDRLKRQEKNFETFQWSEDAIELYLWYPYESPEEAKPAGSPPTPGTLA